MRGLEPLKILKKIRLKRIYMNAWVVRADSFLLSQWKGIGFLYQTEIPHAMVNVVRFHWLWARSSAFSGLFPYLRNANDKDLSLEVVAKVK